MSRERRKRQSDQTGDHREGLRKVIKTHSSDVQCPVCDVTLKPGTLAQHYQQELEKLQPTTASTNTRRDSDRRRRKDGGEMATLQEARQTLEATKRKRFLFEHPNQSHDQPGPSHQANMCETCGIQLPTDDEQAAIHVSSCCQGQPSPPGSSDSDEEYEEYTWCNVTRVRATSMLSAETRANIFNGTVVSKAMDGDSSFDVDVEDDSTSVYGPPQYSFSDITSVANNGCDIQGETLNEVPCDLRRESCDLKAESCDQLKTKSSAQCLICMDVYTQPLVSIQCWHVFCEQCWLQALEDKKLCPKCKTITCASDLRRIFL